MPKIIQLSPHIANLIAAGEVVERPASVVKELLENAVDAGASQVTVEIRNGGMTFLRVTDNGCGMSPEDARTAFLRHATSKLRSAEDLAAIATMGFRGEALAAIASVSRIDLLTKTPGAISGTSLQLEAGTITEESEAGCPEGTTIIVRDLFFNTPARMKFMKADTVEGGKVSTAVQLQALAHPEVAFRFIRDGKETLSTPGTGGLEAAIYCVYGRECAKMVKLDSRWENYTLTGYVSKPTDARPSRNMQTFFVNDRPIKSRLLIAAFEEAYRNQLMVGKFPACVLHLKVPANTVDVNVHPAKTEVKFLNEKAVFDCIHYCVLGALNQTPDRPQMQFQPHYTPATTPSKTPTGVLSQSPAKRDDFFRTMSSHEFQNFSSAIKQAPQPEQTTAVATADAVAHAPHDTVHQKVLYPSYESPIPSSFGTGTVVPPTIPSAESNASATQSETVQDSANEPEQQTLEMPEIAPWRLVGELYSSYIIVEQGEDAFLIDKHAAHERILFEKLKSNQEPISSQTLLTPVPCHLRPDCIATLLAETALLSELGFEVESFGANTILVRQLPMDLDITQITDTLDALAADLLNGRRERPDTVRDEVLHTVACKAAIKAGWKTDSAELTALVKTVMDREDLKYCPHGRPICITLSKKQLEKQFKRS